MSESKGFFGRLKHELFKQRQGPISGIKKILGSQKPVAEVLEELEEALILSDVGVHAAGNIISALREGVKKNRLKDSGAIFNKLKEEMVNIIRESHSTLSPDDHNPFVIMMVGVNGCGKTTTIGKLAARFTGEGKKVLVAAGDTFRAAATDQLAVWCKRSGAGMIHHKNGASPAAVVFDAVQAAKAKKYDILIIDTAGRLQTKSNLMDELKKIVRIVERDIPGAPHETLLVLDATIGQNALSQAKIFHQAAPLTGLVLTKLEGTAKGGVVVHIIDEMKLPVTLIGCGEGIDDLRDFDPSVFIEELLEGSAKDEEKVEALPEENANDEEKEE